MNCRTTTNLFEISGVYFFFKSRFASSMEKEFLINHIFKSSSSLTWSALVLPPNSGYWLLQQNHITSTSSWIPGFLWCFGWHCSSLNLWTVRFWYTNGSFLAWNEVKGALWAPKYAAWSCSATTNFHIQQGSLLLLGFLGSSMRMISYLAAWSFIIFFTCTVLPLYFPQIVNTDFAVGKPYKDP